MNLYLFILLDLRVKVSFTLSNHLLALKQQNIIPGGGGDTGEVLDCGRGVLRINPL